MADVTRSDQAQRPVSRAVRPEGRSFLDVLAPEDKESFLSLCQPVTYRFGDVVVHQEEKADAVYLVVNGRARVVQVQADGQELMLGRVGPGEVFGEVALLEGGLRTATVRASEELTV